MGIKPTCDMCGEELGEFGGLAFSPPLSLEKNLVMKYHLCRGCFEKVIQFIRKR